MLTAQQQNSNLIYCISQDPNSLIVLEDPKNILATMLKNHEITNFIWVDPYLTPEIEHTIQDIRTQLKTSITIVTQINEIQKHLTKYNHNIYYVIIFTQAISQSINYIARYDKIKCYVKYPIDFNFDNECSPEVHEDTEQVIVAQSKINLMNTLKKCLNRNQEFQELNSFIFVEKEPTKYIEYARVLNTMLTLQLHPNVVSQIYENLQILIDSLTETSDYFSGKCKQLKYIMVEFKEQVSLQRAIALYTYQSGFYTLINNLLRSTQAWSQIYYIQPILKLLAYAIQYLCWIDPNEQEQFYCYRGSHVFCKEFEQFYGCVGAMVINLGFLSTSLDIEQARNFMKNVLFVIFVNETNTDEALPKAKPTLFSGGYANIQKHSYFEYQQQILFNPLCSFKVLQIKQIQLDKETTNYIIKLQYGYMQRLKKTSSQELSQIQQIYMGINKYCQSEIPGIFCQGNILLRSQKYEKVGLLYWKKYCQISKQEANIIIGNYYLAKFYYQARNYQSSQAILTQILQKISHKRQTCVQFYNQQNRYLRKYEISTYEVIGDIKMINKKVNQAYKCYDKCIRLLKENKQYVFLQKQLIQRMVNVLSQKGQNQKALSLVNLQQYQKFGKYQIGYAGILNAVGIIYRQQKKYSLSLQAYNKCSKIRVSILGQFNQNYLSTLNNMAVVYENLQQYQNSYLLYSKILEIMKKNRKNFTINYMYTLSALGISCWKLGKNQQVMQIIDDIEKSLENGEMVQENQQFIQTVFNFGLLNFCYGRYRQAQKYLLYCLQIQQKYYGTAHPSIHQTKLSLLHVYKCTNPYNMYPFLKKYRNQHKESIQPRKLLQQCIEWTKYYICIGDFDNVEKCCGRYLRLRQRVWRKGSGSMVSRTWGCTAGNGKNSDRNQNIWKKKSYPITGSEEQKYADDIFKAMKPIELKKRQNKTKYRATKSYITFL